MKKVLKGMIVICALIIGTSYVHASQKRNRTQKPTSPTKSVPTKAPAATRSSKPSNVRPLKASARSTPASAPKPIRQPSTPVPNQRTGIQKLGTTSVSPRISVARKTPALIAQSRQAGKTPSRTAPIRRTSLATPIKATTQSDSPKKKITMVHQAAASRKVSSLRPATPVVKPKPVECTICLEPCTEQNPNVIKHPCSGGSLMHVICAECMATKLKNDKAFECPTCRQEYSERIKQSAMPISIQEYYNCVRGVHRRAQEAEAEHLHLLRQQVTEQHQLITNLQQQILQWQEYYNKQQSTDRRAVERELRYQRFQRDY